jgi:thiamine biosynthesis lipoprotein
MSGSSKGLRAAALAFLGSAWFFSAVPVGPSYHLLTGRAQGTTYHIRYAADRALLDSADVAALFAEVDCSLSLYLDSSLICRFNRSQKGVRADTHMLRVVRKSLQVYELSRGAFDITVKPLLDLFKSHPNPTEGEVGAAMRCLGSHRMRIEGDSLLKDCPALQLDGNGIAQGYTVDLLAARLESKGIGDYLVELGGEIRSRGVNPRGEPWVLGVEAPTEDGLGTLLAKRIRPDGMSVTTSGNWHLRQGTDGRRVVHIMDPRRGRPSDNGMVSATVVAGDAMTADALDNVCMVLGPADGVRFIESLSDAEAWLVYRDGKGRLVDTCTSGLHRFEAR